MAKAQTCELRSSLATVHEGSWNEVWW